MTRLHADPVEVHRRDDEPDQFLWRGRLYVVQEVLARWTQSGGWWRGEAVRDLTAGERVADAPAPVDAPVDGPAPAHADVGPMALDENERDWWRVEAAAGRQSGSGVFDLCFAWSTGDWSLARVLD